MIISRAPLRISFFGGGTDYPEYFLKQGGAVLGTAVDKFSYVTASPFMSHLFDYSIRVSYRKVELTKDVREIEHAVFRECLKLCGFEKDVELHNVADSPPSPVSARPRPSRFLCCTRSTVSRVNSSIRTNWPARPFTSAAYPAGKRRVPGPDFCRLWRI